MKLFKSPAIGLLGGALLLLAVQSAQADFELTDSAGKRILLKDDGTWSYVDGAAKPPAPPASAPKKNVDFADLQLVQRLEASGGCRFDMTLTNKLPYFIGSVVPEFSVYRQNNVVYMSKLLGFTSIKPGDKLSRSIQFEGLSCADIVKVQVSGGDRCVMGELDKFSDEKGVCLALLRVVPSPLVTFEK